MSFDLSGIELTDEFKRALTLIELEDRNIFITGKAGSGKSTLLKCFRAVTEKRAVFLAPTGVAAINIGGQTIHSFFRFPPKLLKPEEIRPHGDRTLFRELDTIVIDEISMVRADLMDAIDYFLRLVRRKPELPFGGVQMVVFGDLFQLPPIVRGKELENYFSSVYEAPYFFYSKVFASSKFDCLELTKIYRQTDEDFIRLLNGVRDNSLLAADLQKLNSQTTRSGNMNIAEDCVTLTSTNAAALKINRYFLDKIRKRAFFYTAKTDGQFKQNDYPTETVLELKEGARIMLLRNDPDKRWVNGTIAVVDSLEEDKIVIEVDGEKFSVSKETWHKIKYSFNKTEDLLKEEVVGSFRQFPLCLAWAITIHKSQGQSFKNIHIDLGYGAFAHGQTYVALSRCLSLEGIKLRRPIYRRDIMFDPRIYEYSKIFNMIGSVNGACA